MSLCAMCGMQLFGETDLCPHHHSAQPSDWAVDNRIMCDFIHRGVVPQRVVAADDCDDYALVFDALECTPVSCAA